VRIPQAPLWSFLLTYGARFGEARTLAWGHVDRERATVTLRPENTMTHRARCVPISREFAAELAQLRTLHARALGRAVGDADRVFLTPEARPQREDTTNARHYTRLEVENVREVMQGGERAEAGAGWGRVRVPGWAASIIVADRDSMPTPAETWPFDQPRDCASICLRSIVFGGEPILFVSHDLDDHGWQFLGLEDADEADACLIALEEAVELDRSVLELADLPPGWCAWRPGRTSPWQRAPETAEDHAADSGEHSP
jgi:hypothetical protein